MNEPARRSEPPAIAIEQDHPTRRLDADALRRLARHVAEAEGRAVAFLSIVLAGHNLVRRLNRTHLSHNYVTDVLAFPLGDTDETGSGPIDGEIYVDLDTAAERCGEFGASFEEEARRYVVHGLLHLAGHDDTTPDGKAAMHALEDRYLAEAP